MSDFQTRFNELLASFKGNDTDVANLLGVTKQAVSNWRNGSRSPRKDTIVEIAKKFNVSIEWLMGFDEPKTVIRDNPERKEWNVAYPAGVALHRTDEPTGPSNNDIDDQQLYKIVKAVAQFQRADERSMSPQARIIAAGVDKLPEAERDKALAILRTVFEQYSDYFKEN